MTKLFENEFFLQVGIGMCSLAATSKTNKMKSVLVMQHKSANPQISLGFAKNVSSSLQKN